MVSRSDVHAMLEVSLMVACLPPVNYVPERHDIMRSDGSTWEFHIPSS